MLMDLFTPEGNLDHALEEIGRPIASGLRQLLFSL